MGVLKSSKKEINPHYIDYKLDRIGSLLVELLEEMNSQMRSEYRDEVFVLTVKNASDNVIKHVKKRKNRFTKSINSKIYRELIIKKDRNHRQKKDWLIILIWKPSGVVLSLDSHKRIDEWCFD